MDTNCGPLYDASEALSCERWYAVSNSNVWGASPLQVRSAKGPGTLSERRKCVAVHTQRLISKYKMLFAPGSDGCIQPLTHRSRQSTKGILMWKVGVCKGVVFARVVQTRPSSRLHSPLSRLECRSSSFRAVSWPSSRGILPATFSMTAGHKQRQTLGCDDTRIFGGRKSWRRMLKLCLNIFVRDLPKYRLVSRLPWRKNIDSIKCSLMRRKLVWRACKTSSPVPTQKCHDATRIWAGKVSEQPLKPACFYILTVDVQKRLATHEKKIVRQEQCIPYPNGQKKNPPAERKTALHRSSAS